MKIMERKLNIIGPVSQNDEIIKERSILSKLEVVAYETLKQQINFVISQCKNTSMFSRSNFQVPISLIILGRITSFILKFLKNMSLTLIRWTIFKTENFQKFLCLLKTVLILQNLTSF